jgi:hypothetical protein
LEDTVKPYFNREITERPRSGGGVKTPKGSRRRDKINDHSPKREKIARKWSWNPKEFTDVIGPLYHYLLKQVGRPWNKVYSEIVALFPKTNVVNRHVYTHVFQFVETEVVMLNGFPHHKSVYGWHREDLTPLSNYSHRIQMYVHPENGLLYRLKKNLKRKVQEKQQPGIPVYPGVQYHKIGGIWHEVRLRRLRGTEGIGAFGRFDLQDKVLGVTYYTAEEHKRIYGNMNVIAMSARRLSNKEIHQAGLDRSRDRLPQLAC